MAFDAQLLQVGANDSERRNLRHAGERRPKMTGEGRLVCRIEIAVTDKSGQEFGLVAGWIEVELGALNDRVDDALAAISDEGNCILAPTLEGKDQGSRRYCDDDTESGGQGDAYGESTRPPS